MMNSGVSARSPNAAQTRSNSALLHHLDAAERQPGQLQACQRADFGQLHLVEFVQDLFGAEVDFHRQRQESLGAALDDVGRRPRQQQVDGVGLERANAGHRLGKIAVERGALGFGGAVNGTGVRKRQPTTLRPSVHGS